MESVWQLLKLPMQPSNFIARNLPKRNESICLHKDISTNIYASVIHNSLKVELIQMSINQWMDIQNVVYPCSGIQFSNIKEWNTWAVMTWVILRNLMLIGINQIYKLVVVWFHYEISIEGISIETVSRSGCLRLEVGARIKSKKAWGGLPCASDSSWCWKCLKLEGGKIQILQIY